MAQIKIGTDRKEIEIIRDGEKVGAVYFSAGDYGLMKRIEIARDNIQAAAKEQATKEYTNFEDELDALNELDKVVKAEIDRAFNYSCSKVVFGDMWAVTTDENGQTAVESFLQGALDFIADEMQKNLRKTRDVTEKYLSKYTSDKTADIGGKETEA